MRPLTMDGSGQAQSTRPVLSILFSSAKEPAAATLTSTKQCHFKSNQILFVHLFSSSV